MAFGSYQAAKEDWVAPRIEGCGALEGGSVEPAESCGVHEGQRRGADHHGKFRIHPKLRHARSEIGNPVIYRKARKTNEKEVAA